MHGCQNPHMPVIGLSAYLEPARWGAWDMPAALVPKWYLDLLRAADLDVVLLPPGVGPDAIARLDGLVLAGGADVDAARYGAAPDPTADVPRTERDASESATYRRARALGMPVLGVCRGLQVMAVEHGGTLVQDLPAAGYGSAHRERPGTFTDHAATFTDGVLADVYGPGPVVVNSSHHQAVASSGTLRVTGRAADGTVESCDDPDADFCVGVQWHPEHPERRDADLPLVRAFAAAVRRYAAGRADPAGPPTTG